MNKIPIEFFDEVDLTTLRSWHPMEKDGCFFFTDVQVKKIGSILEKKLPDGTFLKGAAQERSALMQVVVKVLQLQRQAKTVADCAAILSCAATVMSIDPGLGRRILPLLKTPETLRQRERK